jgi:hypothetical protein
VAALAIAGAAAAGWFLWKRSNATPEPPPVAAEPAPVEPAKPVPEPLSAEPDPTQTLAEAVGVDAGARSPASEPPISRRPTGAPPEETAAAAADPEPAEPYTGTAPPGSPVVTETPVTIPAPAEPLPLTAPDGAAASHVTAIEWRGASDLVIRGDGAFAAGSFSYSEIGGENPRVLVKLRGMAGPFRGAAGGASSLARGVRTGYHAGGRGNEVHVVVDLATPAASVAALAPEGQTLVLRFAAR